MSKVLLISACAWALAQLIKVVTVLIKEKRLDLSYFVTSGGMPSAQQSIVLNRIVREIMVKRPRDEVEHDLRELIGHTPFQVIIGGLLGVGIAWVWLAVGG